MNGNGSPAKKLDGRDKAAVKRVAASVGGGAGFAAIVMLIVAWAVRTYAPPSFVETTWPAIEPILVSLLTAAAAFLFDLFRRWLTDTTQG